MTIYDDHVWRLSSQAPYPVYDVVLPKDLEWIDEFTWNPVSQDIKSSLTGALFINEYKKLQGREITLNGQDDMCWIQRPLVETLYAMRNTSQIAMTLEFIQASYNETIDAWTFGSAHISHEVMFRQNDSPVEVESAKRFDNFNPDSWFKVTSIKLIEIGSTSPINPCS